MRRNCFLLYVLTMLGAYPTAILSAQDLLPQIIRRPATDEVVHLPVGSTGSSRLEATVSAISGNLHISIPLFEERQRGGLRLNYRLVYDSTVWDQYFTNDTFRVFPRNGSGWHVASDIVSDLGPSPFGFYTVQNFSCPPRGEVSHDEDNVYGYSTFYLVDEDHTQHAFTLDGQITDDRSCGTANGNSSSSGYSDDGQGYFLSITDYTQIDHIFAPDGSAFYSGPGYDSYYQDFNGNRLTSRTDPTTGSFSLIDSHGKSDQGSTSGIRSPLDSNAFYSSLPVCTDFSGAEQYCQDLPDLLTSVTLPSGQKYALTYDTGTIPGHYGALTGMDLPNGGHLSFSYQVGVSDQPDQHQLNRVVSASVDAAQYQFAFTTSSVRQLCGVAVAPTSTCVTGPQRWDGGLKQFVRDDTIYSAVNIGPVPWLSTVTSYSGSATSHNTLTSVDLSDFTVTGQAKRITTTLGDGLTSTTKFVYGGAPAETKISFPIEKDEWNFGSNVNGVADRQLLVDYDRSPALMAAHIVNKPKRVRTFDNGQLLAETDYGYDENPISSSSGYKGTTVYGIASHNDADYSASRQTGRGNLTSVRQLVSASANVWRQTSYRYNVLGELISTTNPRGNVTDMDYSDCFEQACQDHGTFAFGTAQRDALGHETKMSYSFGDGNVVSVVHPNGAVTTYTRDATGRITDRTLSDGRGVHIDYGGGGVPQVITTSTHASPSPDQTITNTLDGQGRTILEELVGNASIRSSFDNLAHLQAVSNPQGSQPAAQDGFRSYSYDALGRMEFECDVDNGTSAAQCSSGNAYSSVTYSGNKKILKDEDGNQRQLVVDVWNQVSSVIEAGGASTKYRYDAQGNLTGVDQLGSDSDHPRRRVFTYNGTSNLVTASSPESGLTCYGLLTGSVCHDGYDGNGNLNGPLYIA